MCQVEYKAMHYCSNVVRAVHQLLHKLQYHGMLSSTTSLYDVNKQANKLVEEVPVSFGNVMAQCSIELCKSATEHVNKCSIASIFITNNINI